MSGPSTEPKKKPSMLRMPTGVKKDKPKSEEDDDFDMSMLNADQLARLKRAFGIFDKDDSGTISSQEMMQVLRLLGSNPSKGEMDDMLKSIDKNQDGVVDLNEFARVWWKREQQNIEADFELELELAFQLFDTDDSGFITRDELREKLTTLGEKLTEQEVDELLAEADSDNNGSISLEEFKALPFWRM